MKNENTKNISGNCLCGEVSFSCSNTFKAFHLCHCKQCQKTSGSAYAANLFTEPDNITWTSGKQFIKRYDMPNRSISKAFCTECGCGLPYLSGTGAALIVPAGCLDGVPNIDPQDNIFCAEKVTWFEQTITAPEFKGFSKS